MRRSRTRGRMLAVALLLCACLVSGCASCHLPRIDPSGEHIFVSENPAAAPSAIIPPPAGPPADYHDEPGGQLPWDDVAVTLSPRVTVAPVGSEVVLLAGVRGPDNYLRTNRRLQWSVAPGGVGHFVDVGRSGLTDVLLGDFNRPRKIDNTTAIGSTSRWYLRLHRGSPTPADDVYVLAGQGWITVTSPIEGSSYVTVFAPTVYPWDCRTQSATIHWVDAQWRFPPLAINPVGTKHTFTTTVMRQSDQTPCVGWHVRYEVAGGPAAGFAPDGAPSVEVATDPAGQASVEIFQKQPGPGTNRINIEVIRPAELPGAGGRRLVVGSGSTMKTWTAPAIALRKIGPAVGSVGATLTYRTEVLNPGDLPAKDVLLTDNIPEGLSYLRSNPPAEVAGAKLQWRLGQLNPGERRLVEVNFRADRQGSVTNCAEAVAAGGLKAAHCATTTITAPTLDVKVTGPTQATVGSQVTFQVLVVNRSAVPATKLLIKDRFEAGLEHAVAKSPIERELGDLAPGQTHLIQVTFRVTKTGRLCHTVEVAGAGGVLAAAEACVTAVEAAPGAAPVPTPGTAPGAGVPPGALPGVGPGVRPGPAPKPAVKLSVAVKRATPETQTVGDTARFVMDVSNKGDRAVSNLKLVAQYDAALHPTMATAGNKPQADGLAWTIDAIPAGKTAEYEIHCRCQAAAAKACVRATVTAPDGAQASDEACLTIREAAAETRPEGAPPGRIPPKEPPSGIAPRPATAEGLSMTVVGLFNPITLGKDLTYAVQVSNNTQAVDRLVRVTVTVPEGMVPVPLGTTGPPLTGPHPEGQTLRFDPVPELRPGETLQYRIRAHTRQPGQYRFRVELTSQNQPKPKIVEETTEVLQ